MVLLILVLDESIYGYFRNTSKSERLLNYSHEPIKLVKLGTMLMNAAECNAGMIVCEDVVQNHEKQLGKSA